MDFYPITKTIYELFQLIGTGKYVAAALGVNVTAIFGPTNERETRPLGSGRRSVVHTDTWCRPCMLRECPLTHRCMTGVGVETVVTDVRANL